MKSLLKLRQSINLSICIWLLRLRIHRIIAEERKAQESYALFLYYRSALDL
jgi:hypothetical protein